MYILTYITVSLYRAHSYSGPDAPPQAVEVIPDSSTTLNVSWEPVPAINQNGKITEYLIEYTQSRFPEQLPTSLTMVEPAESRNVTLTELGEYVTYSVSVRAHTSIGEGPFSSEVDSRTEQDGIIARL